MSQHQLNPIEQTPELEAPHFDDLTLDKQVIKDLEPANDGQVRAGARPLLSPSTAPQA